MDSLRKNEPGRLARCSLIIVLVLLVATSCTDAGVLSDQDSEDANLSTDTTSDEFATAAERIAFAQQYVVFQGPVMDVHFDIVYFDNSDDRLPGPSDWDMTFVFVVDPSTVASWTEGHIDAEFTPTSAHALLEQAGFSPATLTGEAQQFEGVGSRLTLHAEDGLVIQHAFSIPLS